MNVVSLVAELEAMADQFCVQGRVVETGTHSSLLAKAGKSDCEVWCLNLREMQKLFHTRLTNTASEQSPART